MAFHTERLSRQLRHPIHFVYGNDRSGRPCHFFILAPQHQYSVLENHFGHGTVDVRDYGRIVASGFGLTPSAETLQHLKDIYGYDFPQS